jgi:hypothetical protein
VAAAVAARAPTASRGQCDACRGQQPRSAVDTEAAGAEPVSSPAT